MTRDGVRQGLAQLVSDTAFYTTALVLRRATSLVTFPILVRYLTLREFGALAVLGTLQELLGVVLQVGVPNAADRFYFDCRTEGERRRLLGTLFVLLMAVSLAASLGLLWLGPWLWTRVVRDVPFHPLVSLTVVTAFLSGIAVLPRSLFRVTNRVPLFTALTAGQAALTAGLSLLLVAGLGLGVLGAVLANLGAAAVFFSCSPLV